jgi:hypothetical protein
MFTICFNVHSLSVLRAQSVFILRYYLKTKSDCFTVIRVAEIQFSFWTRDRNSYKLFK